MSRDSATAPESKRDSVVNGPFVAQPAVVTLPQSNRELGTAVFSPGARLVASYAYNTQSKTVKLWDMENKRLRFAFPALAKWPSLLVFSPDEKLLASLIPGDAVRVWNVQTGKLQFNWKVEAGEVETLAFAPDGNLFTVKTLSAQRKLVTPTLLKWDLRTGRQIQTFSGSAPSYDLGVPRSVVCVLSPNGKIWVTGDEQGRIEWRDTETGKLLKQLKPELRGPGKYDTFASPIQHLTYSPDGSVLACQNRAGEATLWTSDRKQMLTTQPLLCGNVHRLAFSHDNSLLATSEALWSTQTGQRIQTLGKQSGLNPAPSPNLLTFAFSRYNTKLIALNGKGELFTWRRKTASELESEKRDHVKPSRVTLIRRETLPLPKEPRRRSSELQPSLEHQALD